MDYTESLSFQVPWQQSGTFQLLVAVDIDNEVEEYAFEENNLRACDVATTVHLTPPPDLEMEILEAPENNIAGRPFTVSYKVRNAGASSPSADRWHDAVYLSTDSVLDTAQDIRLTSLRIASPCDSCDDEAASFAPEAEYTRHLTVTLPMMSEGDFFLLAACDVNGDVYEVDTRNNVQGVPVAVESRWADLVVTELRASPSTSAGGPMLVTWRIRNQGVGATMAGSWTDKIMISQDEVLGNGDDGLLASVRHQGRLAPEQDYTVSRLVELPFSGFTGDCLVYVVADSENEVFEGPEGEVNNRADPDQTHVDRHFADLAVIGGSVTVENRRLRVQWTVENQGDVYTNARRWFDECRLSANQTWGDADDRSLGGAYRTGGLLNPGEVYHASVLLEIPDDTVDMRYVLIKADAADQVLEHGVEDNNVLIAATVTAHPDLEPGDIALTDLRLSVDLVVSDVVVPEEAVSGSEIPVSWTVRNTGDPLSAEEPFPPECPDGQWEDALFLSRDMVLDMEHDTFLGMQRTATAELLTSAEEGQPQYQYRSCEHTLNLPDGVSGSYYLIVATDRYDTVHERGAERNNTATHAIPLDIVLPTPADLTVGSIRAWSRAWTGQSMWVGYDLLNPSDAVAEGHWRNHFYLSTDRQLDAADQRLGEASGSGPVEAGGSRDSSGWFPVPAAGGEYYVIVHADAYNQYPELDETNNIGVSEETVTIEVPSLLSVAGTGSVMIDARMDHAYGRSYNYRFHAEEGQKITLTAEWQHTEVDRRWNITQAYVARGRIPTPVDCDFGGVEYFDEDGCLLSSKLTAEQSRAAPLTFVVETSGLHYLHLDVRPHLQPPEEYQYYPSREVFRLTITPTDIDLWQTGVEVFKVVRREWSETLTHTVQSVVTMPPWWRRWCGRYKRESLYYGFEAEQGQAVCLSAQRLGLRMADFDEGYWNDTAIFRKDRSISTSVYVAHERMPTPVDHDFGGDLSSCYFTGSRSGPLTIPSTQAGTYYVRVDLQCFPRVNREWVVTEHGVYETHYDGVERFSLSVVDIPFVVADVSPSRAGNAGLATLKVTATTFKTPHPVELVQEDQVVRRAVDVALQPDDPSCAFVTFDLTGLSPGRYELGMTSIEEESDSFPLEVVSGVGPGPDASVDGPALVREGRTYLFYVNYGNRGDADTVAPLLMIENLDDNPFALSRKDLRDAPPQPGRTLQVMGISHNGPAGVLRPGYVNSIPVFFRTAPGNGNFRVHTIRADNDRPLDIAEIERLVRPVTMSDEEWQQLRPRLAARVGPTWGTYVQALAGTASTLSRYGQRTASVRELLYALFSQAAYDVVPSPVAYVLAHPEGAELVEASVTALGFDGRILAQAVTDSRGAYRFTSPWSGAESVRAEATGHARKVVEITPAITGLRPPVLVLQPESRIHGTVIAPQLDQEGLRLWVAARLEGSVGRQYIYHGQLRELTPDELNDGGLPPGSYAFQIPGMPAGDYRVTFLSHGYLERTVAVTLGEAEVYSLDPVTLTRAATIGGQLVDGTTGAAVPGGFVRLFASERPVAAALSGSNGEFAFDRLTSGQYTLRAGGIATAGIAEMTVGLAEGEQLSSVSLTLMAGGRVVGTVRAAQAPLNGLLVVAQNGAGRIIGAVTDSDGHYELEGLQPGEWRIGIGTVHTSDAVSLEIGDDEEQVEQDLDTVFDGQVSGTVTLADGTPVQGATVQLLEYGRFVVGTRTDSDGRYVFHLAGGGTYELLALCDGASFDPVAGLVVDNGETVQRDIAAGSAVLNVLFTGNVDSGHSGGTVLLSRWLNGTSYTAGSYDVDGIEDVAFGHLAPGEYSLTFLGNGQCGGHCLVSVSSGTQDVELGVHPQYVLSGAVLNAEGQPVPGAVLNLVNIANPLRRRLTASNATGRYEISSVGAGVYDLSVWAPGCELAVQTDVLVNEDTSLSVDVLPAVSTISGRVISNTGRPISSICVQISGARDELLAETVTDREGNWRVEGVHGEDLRIEVRVPSFLTSEIRPVTVALGQSRDVGEIELEFVAVGQGWLPTAKRSLLYNGSAGLAEMLRTRSETESGWLDSLLEHYGPRRSDHLGRGDVPLVTSDDCLACMELFESLYWDAIPAQNPAYQRILDSESEIDVQRLVVAGVFAGELATVAGTLAGIVISAEALLAALPSSSLAAPVVTVSAGGAIGSSAAAGPAAVLTVTNNIVSIVGGINGLVGCIQSAITADSGTETSDSIDRAANTASNLQSTVHSTIGLMEDVLIHPEYQKAFGGYAGAMGILGGFIAIRSAVESAMLINTAEQVNELIRLEEHRDDMVREYENRVRHANNLLRRYQNCRAERPCRDQDSDDDGDDEDEDELDDPPRYRPSSDDSPDDQDDYDPDTVVSFDPNDIIGPAGFGEEGWVGGSKPLPYRIRFENVPEATAPAQGVMIVQQLDDDLDWRTFRVDDFGWGDIHVDVPGDQGYYIGQVDLPDSGGLVVDVVANVDVIAGEITWQFQTIDPVTGRTPEDALAGFLPPNDENGIGEGYVTYTVRPKADVESGSVIAAEATIVFDANEPIDTPRISNLLDSAPPVSQMESVTLADAQTGEMQAAWSGSDEGGTALASHSVYVSVDNGPFHPWLEGTQLTEAPYTGQPGHTYAFYCVGHDYAGNTGTPPQQHDVWLAVPGTPPVAGNDNYETAEDEILQVDSASGVLANDHDPDGRDLTATLETDAQHGVVELLPDGSFTYTPEADYYGPDSFTYIVADGTDAHVTGSVTLTVQSVSDPPVAVNDAYAVDEDCGTMTLDVLANDADGDGDPLVIVAAGPAAHGEVAVVDGELHYTPDADYCGPDAFIYTLQDNGRNQAGASVTVSVLAVNDPPVAVNDTLTVDQNTEYAFVDVLGNDHDIDSPRLTVSLFEPPEHGAAELFEGGVVYAPDQGYYGPDWFSCTVSDDAGGSAASSVEVTVLGKLEFELHPGWNLVAVPFQPLCPVLQELLPNSGLMEAWRWNNGYERASALRPLKGHWLYIAPTERNTATSATVRGTRLEVETISVVQGWNLLGVSEAFQLAAESDAPWLLPAWSWDPVAKRYVPLEYGAEVQPGLGYWFYFTHEAELRLRP